MGELYTQNLKNPLKWGKLKSVDFPHRGNIYRNLSKSINKIPELSIIDLQFTTKSIKIAPICSNLGQKVQILSNSAEFFGKNSDFGVKFTPDGIILPSGKFYTKNFKSRVNRASLKTALFSHRGNNYTDNGDNNVRNAI